MTTLETKDELVQEILKTSSLELLPRNLGTTAVLTQPRFGVTAADLSFYKQCARERHRPRGPDPSVSSFGEMLLSDSFRMLFLKQFRDVLYGDRACYQAIVEAPLKDRRVPTGSGRALRRRSVRVSTDAARH